MMKEMTCPSCNTVNMILGSLPGGVCTQCHQTVGTMPTAADIQSMQAQQQQELQANQVHVAKLEKATSTVSPFSNIPVLNKIKLPNTNLGRGVLVVLVVAVGLVGAKLKSKYMPKKGTATYSSLGIDTAKADPDKFVSALTSRAKRWRRDAAWWSVTVPGVRPDGTVSLEKGLAPTVTFVSPSRVSAASKMRRKDSIKKYRFGSDRVDGRKKWGASNRWENVTTPDLPTCSIKNLVSTLGELGFTGKQTVDVSFDPVFARGRHEWTVRSKQKALEGTYSMENCSRTK